MSEAKKKYGPNYMEATSVLSKEPDTLPYWCLLAHRCASMAPDLNEVVYDYLAYGTLEDSHHAMLLKSILGNDLVGAAKWQNAFAGTANVTKATLVDWGVFMDRILPTNSWGYKHKVSDWKRMGGMRGICLKQLGGSKRDGFEEDEE
jgi:hypothetical protein